MYTSPLVFAFPVYFSQSTALFKNNPKIVLKYLLYKKLGVMRTINICWEQKYIDWLA